MTRTTFEVKHISIRASNCEEDGDDCSLVIIDAHLGPELHDRVVDTLHLPIYNSASADQLIDALIAARDALKAHGK